MSDCYRHPNGYIIFCQPDGSIERIESPSGEYAYIPEDEADTLRDYFLNELGLWRDEKTGALVVVDSWSEVSEVASVIYSGCTWIAQRLSLMPDWERELLGDVATELDGVITRWRATLAQPPREPV